MRTQAGSSTRDESLPVTVKPSNDDRLCIESAEDSWPLRFGVLCVSAIGLSLGLGLFGFAI